MQKRTLLFLGAGLLLLAATAAGLFYTFPEAFELVKASYRTVEEWARNRGNQIRAAFGISPDRLKPDGDIGPEGISTDRWNELKLETISPPFRSNFRRFIAFAQAVAKSYGAELIVWDAGRSLERQLELYKRGRTTSGTVVTQTIGSWHLFGLAIDLILRDKNGGPDFGDHPSWYTREILPRAKDYGLESLYLTEGIDKPHIQVPKAQWPPVVAQAQTQIKKDFPGLA